MEKRIKVLWITHFSNQNIRERLPLSGRRFINLLKSICGKQKLRYFDFAPWVSRLIEEFKNFEDVELTIVSPHLGLRKKSHEFNLDGIRYFFFKPEDDTISFRIVKTLGWNKRPVYRKNRHYIGKIVGIVEPDIVNLIGAENAYYSIAALDIKNIPVYLSVQTVLNNQTLTHFGVGNSYEREIEQRIFKQIKYFGCSGRLYYDLIKAYNSAAIFFKMFFPVQEPPMIENVTKIFDFAFYAARVVRNKGIEDVIEALSYVKEVKPGVRLNVIGSCLKEYKVKLMDKIKALDLEDNIHFDGYFALHEDLFKQITKSKFAVVPGITAIINSTVIEAAFLGLPIVTYKTTGTPYLNNEKQCVLLAEIGDIKGLAAYMLKLMSDDNYARKLGTNAKEFVTKTYNSNVLACRLKENYRAVIAHYRWGKEIPNDQIFNVEEFSSSIT